TSADILRLAEEAERRIGDDRNKEFDSTMVDMRILAYLALYHGQRIPAGINYLLYEQTGDMAALNRAIRHESKAIDAYEKIVESAGDVYADDLMMGRSAPPHWRDELALLKGWLKELKKLQKEKQTGKAKPKQKAPDISTYRQDSADAEAPALKHKAITSAKPNRPLTITAEVSDPSGVKWVRLRFRYVTQFEDYKTLEMRPAGRKNRYTATIPGKEISPEWDFMYLFEVMDNKGNGKMYPYFEEQAPYIVVELER
ncbi:MAG: hypothetical protein KAR47_10190, partial [Planctomycetes bacterium]|nr:hypothetical protein [Planctomycetota bacterium]